MPSASSKSEKPASTEATDPLKQAVVIVEHKIRNLEKRKSKLDSYKESNKMLTKEQMVAVSKYDEVIQQLELSKEYFKQFTCISIENNKFKKRQARKDALEKYIVGVNKVKQALLIQEVLQSMSLESVREDFLAGKNGAVKLTPDDLKTLENLSLEMSPKRISDDPQKDRFQKAAEFYMAIIDGKSKEVAGMTGAKLKELMNSITASGYFEKPVTINTNKSQLGTNADEKGTEQGKSQGIVANAIAPTQTAPDGKLAPVLGSGSVQQVIPGPILPGNQPPVMQPNQQIMANVPNIVPTPVSQVESSFFNAQGFKPPAPPSVVPTSCQNARQINEVIQGVTGKFNFLQESELDLAEMNAVIPGNSTVPPSQIPGAPPSGIPTQTFANQNFNGQPSPAHNFPPNYPPQPAAFQPFVPAFPAFPNANPAQNTNAGNRSANPTVPGPINSANPNVPTTNSNILNSNSKSNNIPNSIPVAPNRNPTVGFNQGQQPLSTGFPNQPDVQNLIQASTQPVFQHGNVSVSVNNASKNTVRKENEIKEKPETEKQKSTNWADECVDTSDWNSPNQFSSDGPSNGNKFSTARPNRNVAGFPRNSNGYLGSRGRPAHKQVFRDSQGTNNTGGGGGGSMSYYHNPNDFQPRSSDYRGGNSELRDGSFKERGDFNNRENYSGGFKRGPTNRGPNMKGPMDRGDRGGQGQIQRNNAVGPRGPRNVNRPANGKNGSNDQRQQPSAVGQPSK